MWRTSWRRAAIDGLDALRQGNGATRLQGDGHSPVAKMTSTADFEVAVTELPQPLLSSLSEC